jgi:ATP-binding cassette, subfamily B, bacterial
LGSTGSGKTTVLGLLPRFYDYTQGSIKLDGIELREYPRYFLRQNIGVVEQEAFLFSRSIRENIAYGAGRDVSDAEVEEAARAAAIHDTILSFPEGYNTLIGEKGVTLSGGQKQQAARGAGAYSAQEPAYLDLGRCHVRRRYGNRIRDS